MFYVGFLSTSVPYILFLFASVFYLGYNYLNNKEVECSELTQKEIFIDNDDPSQHESVDLYEFKNVEKATNTTEEPSWDYKTSLKWPSQGNFIKGDYTIIKSFWARPPPISTSLSF